MDADVAPQALMRLQVVWLLGTTLGLAGGFALLAGAARREASPMAQALLAAGMFCVVGALQAGALLWWQGALGRAVLPGRFAALWVGSWAGGGLALLAVAALGNLALAPWIAVPLIVIAQAWLLKSVSWVVAAALGVALGYAVFIGALLLRWRFEASSVPGGPLSLLAIAAGVAVYAGLSALALARVLRSGVAL